MEDRMGPSDQSPSPAAIQASWLEALRQLAAAAPGSPDADRLAARVHDLADEYRMAVARAGDEASGQGRRPPAAKRT
jgi:hypothetical protein